MVKCMLCKSNCDGKIIIKDISLKDLNNNIIDWVVCPKCFNLWASEDYEELTKRLKK